ncbi:MAG: NUDIX domain-containing protein [Bacteroidetes bacterium]|nr:NUDIX domain-containing protein [Bacteroidota bacterium]
MRSKIGNDRFIYPAARILIENEKGEFLTIIRADNGNIGIPAGGLEENETIEECIRREVQEETGLRLKTMEVIGISSHPKRETVHYANGDETQYFTIEFYSNDWEGNIQIQDPKEVLTASFVPFRELQNLPPIEKAALESLAFYRKHQRVLVK